MLLKQFRLGLEGKKRQLPNFTVMLINVNKKVQGQRRSLSSRRQSDVRRRPKCALFLLAPFPNETGGWGMMSHPWVGSLLSLTYFLKFGPT